MASTHQQPLGQSAELHLVNADPQAGAGLAAPVGSIAFMETGYGLFQKTGAGDTAWAKLFPHGIIADPGDAGAIPVTQSGGCALTSGGAGQTRTMAIPTYDGQRVALVMNVDGGGDIATTVAAAFDQAGNTVITMADAGDLVELLGTTVGAALVWRLITNNGCALS